MQKKNFDISVFGVLDSVRAKNGIKDLQWAKFAFGDQKYQSRISELRKMLNNQEGVGRAFSVKKSRQLIGALKQILGVDKLKQEVLSEIKKVADPVNRLQLMIEVLPREDLQTAEIFMETLVQKRVAAGTETDPDKE